MAMTAEQLRQPLLFVIDVKNGLVQKPIGTQLMKGDRQANTVVVRMMDGGDPADLTGVTATGSFIAPPDGAEIPLTGTVSGSEARITLVDECYAASGYFEMSVMLTIGETSRTILSITGDVLRKGSGAVLNVGNVIPSIDDIIAQYQTMLEVTERTQAAANRVEQMQISASGLAGDSNRLGGKPPEYYVQPRNLLDNSDFSNPVNQRGLTSYTGNSPNIDRWKTTNGNMVVDVTSEGLHLSVDSLKPNDGYLRQQLIGDFSSGVYTLAVCVKGGKGSVYFTTDNGTSGVSSVNFPGSSDWTVYCTSGDAGSGTKVPNQFTIRCDLGESVDVKWAALYEGEYTSDTLPPYVPKGYAAELAECRRYYRRIGSEPAGIGFAGSGSNRMYFLTLPDLVGMYGAPDILPSVSPGTVTANVVFNGAYHEFTADTRVRAANGKGTCVLELYNVTMTGDADKTMFEKSLIGMYLSEPLEITAGP